MKVHTICEAWICMKMLQNQGATGVLKSVKKKRENQRISLYFSEISLAADKE